MTDLVLITKLPPFMFCGIYAIPLKTFRARSIGGQDQRPLPALFWFRIPSTKYNVDIWNPIMVHMECTCSGSLPWNTNLESACCCIDFFLLGHVSSRHAITYTVLNLAGIRNCGALSFCNRKVPVLEYTPRNVPTTWARTCVSDVRVYRQIRTLNPTAKPARAALLHKPSII